MAFMVLNPDTGQSPQDAAARAMRAMIKEAIQNGIQPSFLEAAFFSGDPVVAARNFAAFVRLMAGDHLQEIIDRTAQQQIACKTPGYAFVNATLRELMRAVR